MADDDRNRKTQMRLASIAFAQGMRHAVRHVKAEACEVCAELDGEILDIRDVISGKSDHPNGHCTFTYRQ